MRSVIAAIALIRLFIWSNNLWLVVLLAEPIAAAAAAADAADDDGLLVVGLRGDLTDVSLTRSDAL